MEEHVLSNWFIRLGEVWMLSGWDKEREELIRNRG
jgi:hypothetical protein